MAGGLSPITNPWLANFLQNASLQGTLTPEGVLSQQQAQQQQMLDQLAQQSAQAAQAQQQAGQDYQQAAQAAPPQVNPLERFGETLSGNLASVIGQNPAYGQRANQRLTGKQDDLMRARTENLMSLRDIYDQRARAAEHLGDVTTAEKFRQNSERMSLTLQKMQDKAALDQALAKTKNEETPQQKFDREQAGRVALENLRSKNDRANAAAKTVGAGNELSGSLESAKRTDVKGNGYVDLSEWPAKERPAVMQAAQAKGLLALRGDEAKSLQSIDHAVLNIQDVTDAIKAMKPATDFLGRPKQIARVKWAEITQNNPDIAAYPALQLAAINNLLAQIPPGHGFRAAEAEIRRSLENDFPKATDTFPVAMRRINHQLHMIENLRNTITVRDRSKLARPANGPATPSAPQPTDADREYVKTLLGGKK
jgi:hypothetical protein